MSDIPYSSLEASKHIRSLDLTRDLYQIADLIEMSFPLHKDRDGQIYLRQLRKSARDMHFLRWLSSMADLSGDRVAGFVWEEDGKIIGNLSLVPFMENGKKIHLIANVAVKPEHRRRGIGRALTIRAVDILRRKHEPRVWLQVRKQDMGAQELYRSVGFVDRFRRTTWRVKPIQLHTTKELGLDEITVRKRNDADWASQRGWLIPAYPPQMRWNLPVNFHQFEAGPLQEIKNFLDGVNLRHWAIERLGVCQAVLTWQKTNTYANNLWLAHSPDLEPPVLEAALPEILSRLRRRHPLALDLEEGLYSQSLEYLGFKVFRTLIWMSNDLN